MPNSNQKICRVQYIEIVSDSPVTSVYVSLPEWYCTVRCILITVAAAYGVTCHSSRSISKAPRFNTAATEYGVISLLTSCLAPCTGHQPNEADELDRWSTQARGRVVMLLEKIRSENQTGKLERMGRIIVGSNHQFFDFLDFRRWKYEKEVDPRSTKSRRIFRPHPRAWGGKAWGARRKRKPKD